ncbi:hypothetical protein METHB2_760001 [Candidatus Methylobacter favarea]|uniref:Uncharacterized protein n=1 Tax=Candidatus Methylobacter favarea TaxID=2707345 RepID=A0A8S0Y707_9GAMM|nr:hypothetical protein METHB2_760001 [Candidatus Methylobacter favarea]
MFLCLPAQRRGNRLYLTELPCQTTFKITYAGKLSHQAMRRLLSDATF